MITNAHHHYTWQKAPLRYSIKRHCENAVRLAIAVIICIAIALFIALGIWGCFETFMICIGKPTEHFLELHNYCQTLFY